MAGPGPLHELGSGLWQWWTVMTLNELLPTDLADFFSWNFSFIHKKETRVRVRHDLKVVGNQVILNFFSSFYGWGTTNENWKSSFTGGARRHFRSKGTFTPCNHCWFQKAMIEPLPFHTAYGHGNIGSRFLSFSHSQRVRACDIGPLHLHYSIAW